MKYKAYIYEFERGWGNRLDETKEFDSKEERDTFVEEYNSRNTETVVPDWYMTAEAGTP